ncbi:MAG: flagellar export chaperone FliS, partial [Clostridiaceae bacterium]|nr:flagellar export chaperone FliS [Clostridiaceae bacterium]
YNQYKENSILTSTPEELTLMLFNGIVKFIMQSQLAIEENQLEKANNAILRAQDIITELQSTLDTRYEISKSMALLYDYMQRRLIDANVSKDSKVLDEVLSYATELRDTWVQAMKIARKESKA